MDSFGIKLEKEPEVKISNIVLKGELGVELNIERIVFELPQVIYEPEMFPGAIVTISKEINGKQMNFYYLLFNTGRFVSTGIKDERFVQLAIDVLIETVADLLTKEEKQEEFEEEIELEL